MTIMKEITTIASWREHIETIPEQTIVIALFYAPWAAPCTQMRYVLETLAMEYPATTPATTSWVAVNAEEMSEISEEYNISAVPYLVLIRNGKSIDSATGINATKVRAMIEKYALHTNTTPVVSPTTTILEAVDPVKTEGMLSRESTDNQGKKELFSRLGELVKASSVMLFMKGTPSAPECGFSRQIVGILRERSIKYGFFNILADDEVRQGLKEYADWPTYPQLWVGGELVGGLDIVKEELLTNPDFLDPYKAIFAN